MYDIGSIEESSLTLDSPLPRPIDHNIVGDTEEAVAKNNRVDLKVFSPPGIDYKENDCVIIVHGFAHPSEFSYNDPKWGICPRLAQRGLSTVLLPIPFHLDRWPKDFEAYRALRSVIFLVLQNKMRFYLGFRQMLADIEGLIKLLGYSKHSSEHKDRKVHLIGHSMGGLSVLSYQLWAMKTERYICDSTVLLSSGCSMRALSPLEIGLDKGRWRPFRNYYLNDFGQKIDQHYIKEPQYDIFRQLLLGRRIDELDELLNRLEKEVLIIVGAEDDVNPYQYVLSGLDNMPRYLTLVVPEWGHLIQDRKPENHISEDWAKWSNRVLGGITFFFNRH